MHRVRHRGKPINVLDLHGLKATKQTTRARDIEDMRHIEAAIAALKNAVSDHVREMSARPFTTEPEPPKRGIEPRLRAIEERVDPRLVLATRILERAKRQGDNSSIDPETLALYGSEESLKQILNQQDPIVDLDGLLRSMGIDLPRPTT